MYREYIPPESEQYLSVLVVTPQAAHGIYEYHAAARRGYCEDTAFLGDLRFNNPQLSEIIDNFTEGFCMDDRDSELFALGFAITHMALSYQAELADAYLPELQDQLVDGYTANLSLLKENGVSFMQDTLKELKRLNPHLIHCWEEYINGQDEIWSEGDITAFSMGGILLHDLMTQQINSDEMLINYYENRN